MKLALYIKRYIRTRRWLVCAAFFILQASFLLPTATAQTVVIDTTRVKMVAQASDSIVAVVDSMYSALQTDTLVQAADSAIQSLPIPSFMDDDMATIPKKKHQPRNWNTWKPNPQRALWLALVIPGGGQIYNRKYWKLPLVYGGFMGCIYAMTWNSMMYNDYQQAYLDIMDDDPNTASYNKFLHLGRTIDDTNIERYKQIFKSRKDRYRRWRDMSFFVMVGVYALSVIDAYVDAELSEFDISKDLTMKVRPSVMGSGPSRNPLYATSIGVNCSLNF